MASPPRSTAGVVDVVLDVRTAGAEAVYTYLSEGLLAPGTAVLAPLGNRSVLGYVLGDLPSQDALDLEKLRFILSTAPELSLPEPLSDLVLFIAREYQCTPSVALSPAFPPGAADRMCTRWTLAGEDYDPQMLSALQLEIVDTIRADGFIQSLPKKKLNPQIQRALKLLEAKGVVNRMVGLAEPAKPRSASPRYRISADAEKVEAFLKSHSKKRPAQALVLLRLGEMPEAALTTGDIKALCGVTESSVKQLIEAGMLQATDQRKEVRSDPPEPNSDQRIAIDALVDAIRERSSNRFLLFGVTGSGKTEVYLRAAAESLRQGRQVLYLVPEIALATQAVTSLRDRFGEAVAIFHSDVPPNERLDSWLAVRKGECSVVLGARSAVFAPLSNIGLIVVDEEHEGSYKQESSPRYDARRLAEFLGQRHGCPVVFGSATPSIESFSRAESEEITLLSLPNRTADAKLPEVFVEDLREGYRSGKPALFSELLQNKLEAVLGRGEQAILFLNRRAYASFLICRDCGRQFLCKNCSVSLAYSRRLNRLRCHHCGYSERPPATCPACGGTRVSPFGIGTERVEEAVREMFPEARVSRLDRDAVQKKGALEQILAAFGSGEIDVLVGTQMVAKGLNFPGVTLVGVIAADLSLNIPDFRATERTFQLLSQVAGRAGRGAKPGEVVIQTFVPANIAVEAARRHSYHDLYEELAEERKAAGYPPFKRLANVIFVGPNLTDVKGAALQSAGALREHFGDSGEVLGPTDCVIERLNTNWRQHILIKLEPGSEFDGVAEIVDRYRSRTLQITVDVDPQSLL